jgi:hypothetical protein
VNVLAQITGQPDGGSNHHGTIGRITMQATSTQAQPQPQPAQPQPAQPQPARASQVSAVPDTGTLLWVERWTGDDRAPGGAVHDLRSAYVETFWLPVLGPSSIMFLRMLASGLETSPSGFTLDLNDAARSLGLGHRNGRNGPMVRTVDRCCSFGATRIDNGHQLVVRPHLPTLSPRQLARLPQSLQNRHDSAATEDVRPTGVHAARSRCQTLALSLLELGEDPLAAESQLHRWRFHPAMAFESVQWAAGRIRSRDTAATDGHPADHP